MAIKVRAKEQLIKVEKNADTYRPYCVFFFEGTLTIVTFAAK